jgi:hypothetical protein
LKPAVTDKHERKERKEIEREREREGEKINQFEAKLL